MNPHFFQSLEKGICRVSPSKTRFEQSQSSLVIIIGLLNKTELSVDRSRAEYLSPGNPLGSLVT